MFGFIFAATALSYRHKWNYVCWTVRVEITRSPGTFHPWASLHFI